MKAIIKEEPFTKKKQIHVKVEKSNYTFTKINIIFNEDFGWVMKLGLFGTDVLTSAELRKIAEQLDEYNHKKGVTPEKWEARTNSKNL